MNLILKYPLKNYLMIACAFSLLFSCKQQAEETVKRKPDFCESIHRNDSIHLSEMLAPFAKQMETQTGTYVLEDGSGAMVARAWLSEYAEKSIDIQYFIFSTDNVGLIACDYLIRAADRGVKVRLLVDDIMVEASPEDVLILDSHPNIEVKIYNPGIKLGKNLVGKLKKLATDFRGANQRMHNKTFIVDGKIVITGGRNIADEYFDYDHEYNFRDRDVLLLGKTSADVQTSFNTFWSNKLSVPVTALVEATPDMHLDDPKKFDKLHQYACDTANFWPQVREEIKILPQVFKNIQSSGKFFWVDKVHFVSDSPGKNDGTHELEGGGITTDTLAVLIMKAKKSIDIQSPYLITTEASRALFKAAVARGVKIRILTNSLASTDNLEAFSGYQRDRKALLQTGVEIHEFRPDAANRFRIMTGDLQKELAYKPLFGLHAKSMVIDGEIAVIGTFNLDPRSSNLNTECVTVIYADKLAAQVLAGMNEDFKPENSWLTTLQVNPDGQVDKTKRLKAFSKRVVPKSIL